MFKSMPFIQFPVDLDDVWPLVYSNKNEAVRALKTNFIQDFDYKVFSKNAENPQGGRPVEKYNLSTSCLEYFIAGKVDNRKFGHPRY